MPTTTSSDSPSAPVAIGAERLADGRSGRRQRRLRRAREGARARRADPDVAVHQQARHRHRAFLAQPAAPGAPRRPRRRPRWCAAAHEGDPPAPGRSRAAGGDAARPGRRDRGASSGSTATARALGPQHPRGRSRRRAPPELGALRQQGQALEPAGKRAAPAGEVRLEEVEQPVAEHEADAGEPRRARAARCRRGAAGRRQHDDHAASDGAARARPPARPRPRPRPRATPPARRRPGARAPPRPGGVVRRRRAPRRPR